MRFSRRSSRRVGTTERVILVAALVAVTAGGGCGPFRGAPRDTVARDDACALIDSVMAGSGLRSGVRMKGRVTIDVNQYRVRGRFLMTLSPDGDLTFDLTSTTMIGGHREDAVLSFYSDTLRVLDRERGRFYEGADVDAMVADAAGVAVDLGALLRLATGRTPPCGRIADVAVSRGGAGIDLEGRLEGRPFEVVLDRGRIVRSVWPLPLSGDARRDPVETGYGWAQGRLDRLTVYVPARRWRVKLDADND